MHITWLVSWTVASVLTVTGAEEVWVQRVALPANTGMSSHIVSSNWSPSLWQNWYELSTGRRARWRVGTLATSRTAETFRSRISESNNLAELCTHWKALIVMRSDRLLLLLLRQEVDLTSTSLQRLESRYGCTARLRRTRVRLSRNHRDSTKFLKNKNLSWLKTKVKMHKTYLTKFIRFS